MQIFREDGSMDCIPDNVFQFPKQAGGLKLMWTIDSYGGH